MKFTSAILSLLAFSIVPAMAWGDRDRGREVCKLKTFYITKYKTNTVTKFSIQKTTIRTTVIETVTVTAEPDNSVTEEPTAVTDPPPEEGTPAPSTCPPSSIATNVRRSCGPMPSCSKCRDTITATQTFDCNCIRHPNGRRVVNFGQKCPGDCACTTLTLYVPAIGCTSTQTLVSAVV
ncbi:hypothetical protein TWF225_006968 [Orbilia oligospora]|uniref:Uncharacterized protein n=1 Tax=Orbilia oligospora TaxID=2813651 RepID=A0A7C8U7R7_ORBOL|nr:hypothetical protein TWF751_008295 [Orbilia oligospora]KAF3194425.1 hypothetical protein TWF225_006968 [Orbilia oligospora]KAF3242709.1 hypothetical protein TWF128_010445 [Orbilia oligospora]KAF3242710.1 hypothetical protein TWF128_010445 [Orbilia oligospora]KAF3264176.1 hypothetical protein TWF217_003328 [Orbilia oligospora]